MENQDNTLTTAPDQIPNRQSDHAERFFVAAGGAGEAVIAVLLDMGIQSIVLREREVVAAGDESRYECVCTVREKNDSQKMLCYLLAAEAAQFVLRLKSVPTNHADAWEYLEYVSKDKQRGEEDHDAFIDRIVTERRRRIEAGWVQVLGWLNDGNRRHVLERLAERLASRRKKVVTLQGEHEEPFLQKELSITAEERLIMNIFGQFYVSETEQGAESIEA